MEVRKIYFDMDGVLADFNRGIKELCGLEPVDQAKKKPAQDDEMFAAMRAVSHFYDQLKPIPDVLELFETIYQKYGDKCEILSGIPKPKRGIENAAEDKQFWAHRLLADDLKVNIVYREEKKDYCKGPDFILIDDYQKNIKEWEDMGGTGVWFDNIENVYKQLRKLEIL